MTGLTFPYLSEFSFASIGQTSSHHYVPVVTDELLRQRNTCLTKATNIIMVPTRIRFFDNPLCSLLGILGRKSDSAPGMGMEGGGVGGGGN